MTAPPADPHPSSGTVSPAPADAPDEVRIIPVTGLGEIRHGDDLSALLAPLVLRAGIRDGDVLCVAGKLFSKAMGLVIAPEAKQQAVRDQSVRTVARRRHGQVTTEVVQLPHGPIMAAAGIDASNAPDGPLLLPPDPDACARRLRETLQERTGVDLAVVVTDTSSRVWRQGVGDIALGASGLLSLQDLRGDRDRSGRVLGITVRNLADEIAGAADLVKGKATGVPAALVRGLGAAVVDAERSVPASALSRTDSSDWFRRPSLESVWRALGLDLEDEPVAAMDPEPATERLARAEQVALFSVPVDERPLLRTTGALTLVRPTDDSPEAWARAGAVAERLRIAVRAEAIADDHPALLAHLVELQAPEETS